MVEDFCDDLCDRDPDELDGWLDAIIALIAGLRSDHRPGLIIGDGSVYVARNARGDDGARGWWAGDRVRAPGLLDGTDEVGEEPCGAAAVALGGCAEAGDRPD
jgi:hypothetical protein